MLEIVGDDAAKDPSRRYQDEDVREMIAWTNVSG
jgi:hypothetical protein